MANNTFIRTTLECVCAVVLEKRSLSDITDPNYHNNAKVKAYTFGTIRFYHQLNDIVSGLLKKPLKKQDLDLHCLMLVGAYQILYTKTPIHAAIFESVELASVLDKSWAKKLINAILRQIDRDKESIQKTPHYSHPSWLIKKIKSNYPEDFENILKNNNTQAPMSIRVGAHESKESYQNKLTQKGIKSKTLKIVPEALVLENAVPVFDLPDFDKGQCYVQDASAQLSAHLLEPKADECILDACSAPGGKATHLAQICPKAEIIALDLDQDRLTRVSENTERLCISNVTTQLGDATNKDWWNGQLFDKILLDAPCSATGVIRRHPDIKLLRKPKDIARLVKLQEAILDNLWQMLKPGGTLLYATCSILKSENEIQICTFLQNHNDAHEVALDIDWGVPVSAGRQQLPHNEFDGFYYAKLKKTE